MNKGKIDAIDWLSLESGQRLENKSWSEQRLIKLDDDKALVLSGTTENVVDIKLYKSEFGEYYYYQTDEYSCNPLTHLIWKI